MSKMVHVCNNVCTQYKAIRVSKFGPRYHIGQKYCEECALFIQFDGIWCPCCHHKLRVGPKSKKFKEEFVRIG